MDWTKSGELTIQQRILETALLAIPAHTAHMASQIYLSRKVLNTQTTQRTYAHSRVASPMIVLLTLLIHKHSFRQDTLSICHALENYLTP